MIMVGHIFRHSAIVVPTRLLSSNVLVTQAYAQLMLTAMIELIRIADPVSLQIACDALEDNNIAFTVENAGMNELMPLPELMDARLLVAADDEAAARQIIVDLEL